MELSKRLNSIVNVLEIVTVMVLFVVSVSYIIDGSFNPFLYFRF